MTLKGVSAEFVGTALLCWVVVGSGLMGSRLSEDFGVVLLMNAVATVFALALLIFGFGPISGAHFNPAVSLVQWLRGELTFGAFLLYGIAQCAGAITGAALANLSFDRVALELATTVRSSPGLWLGEIAATAGLIAVIVILLERGRNELIPLAVAGWIGSAYFFTSSTSFANPALTLGRTFSDSFAGISASSVAAFVVAQIIGAVVGLLFARAFKTPAPKTIA